MEFNYKVVQVKSNIGNNPAFSEQNTKEHRWTVKWKLLTKLLPNLPISTKKKLLNHVNVESIQFQDNTPLLIRLKRMKHFEPAKQ